MRVACCVSVVLLTGCSSAVPLREAWNWDSTQPVATMALAPAEVNSLAADVAQMQLRRTDIRTRISVETDIRVRQKLYAELHEVGLRLSPLERRQAALLLRPLTAVR